MKLVIDTPIPGLCGAIARSDVGCHARSSHIVWSPEHEDRPRVMVEVCRQHLARVIDHVAVESGQSPDLPMIVRVVTIPWRDKGKQ